MGVLGMVMSAWLAAAVVDPPPQWDVSASGACLEPGRLWEQLQVWRQGAGLPEGLSVQIREAPEGVILTVRDTQREVVRRVFDALPTRCEDRHAAVALVLAIALDDALRASFEATPKPVPAPEPEPEPAPEPPPAPTPPTTPPPTVADEDEARVPARLRVYMGAIGTSSLGGAPAFGAALGVELSPAPWVWFPLGVAALGNRRTLAGGAARTWMPGAELGACFGGQRRGVRVGACARGLFGAVEASGRGYAQDRRVWNPRADVGLGVVLAGQLSERFGLYTRLGADVALVTLGVSVRDAAGVVERVGERRLLGTAAVGGFFGIGSKRTRRGGQ